jgi:hypothetical protein
VLRFDGLEERRQTDWYAKREVVDTARKYAERKKEMRKESKEREGKTDRQEGRKTKRLKNIRSNK